MDLETQSAIQRMVDEHGADNLVVILGAPDAEAAGIAAETVIVGDPSYSGPLAETQLGLTTFHILEDEVREAIPPDVYDDEVGLMADVLDVAAITTEMDMQRAQGGT